jgi:hypothetical protein
MSDNKKKPQRYTIRRSFDFKRPDGINVDVSCRASLEEIAALGPSRCLAFMNGVAIVLSVLNPLTPVGRQNMG